MLYLAFSRGKQDDLSYEISVLIFHAAVTVETASDYHEL